MPLLTFDAALVHYNGKLTEAQDLLMTYKTNDYTPPWKLHEQEREVTGLTRLRDRVKIINDRLAEKHTRN